MSKPTDFLDWATGSSSYRTDPSGLKTTGWADEDYIAGDHLNWLLHTTGLWLRWLDSLHSEFVTVGGGSYDDYADIASAVSASKNKIILTSDIDVTVEQGWTLSNGVIIGNGFKLSGTSAIGTAILKITGNENIIKDLVIQGTNTSGTHTNGFEITSDLNQCYGIRVFQNGTGGTMTDGVDISGDYNQIDVIIKTKLGTMTNTLVDTGTDNDWRLIEA